MCLCPCESFFLCECLCEWRLSCVSVFDCNIVIFGFGIMHGEDLFHLLILYCTSSNYWLYLRHKKLFSLLPLFLRLLLRPRLELRLKPGQLQAPVCRRNQSGFNRRLQNASAKHNRPFLSYWNQNFSLFMIIIQSISIPDLNPPNATMTLEYFPYESKINVCSPRIQENNIGQCYAGCCRPKT